MEIKHNERDWTGQIIAWIKAAIANGESVFQDATNDTGIKLSSGRTKFPDILLFVDRISGVVFNGWELKFPDTPVDDAEMQANALENAQRLRSHSIVTWNGTEAVIWETTNDTYSISALSRLKTYPRISSIATREDMSDHVKYAYNEPLLKKRALEILHDLDVLYTEGRLKSAIDVSGNIINAIGTAAKLVIPQLQAAIVDRIGEDREFRDEFQRWKIYESSTLKMLETSSRRQECVVPEHVLACFTFYNLIGKVMFYLTLSENLKGELPVISIFSEGDVLGKVQHCLTNYYPTIVNVVRGERTGWNKMFIIRNEDVEKSKIAPQYLIPYQKNTTSLKRIGFYGNTLHSLFVCNDDISTLDSGTKGWKNTFKDVPNKNASKTISQACAGHRPYWYSLNPPKVHVITAINPYERFFFTYSKQPFAIDQRLIGLQVKEPYDVELVAALLNATITFLILENKRTSRNLGALDLNATYLKEIRTLNPDSLNKRQKDRILKAFKPLKEREVKTISEEVAMKDRKNFDKVVLECYGLNTSLLPMVYAWLVSSVQSRIMKSRKMDDKQG